MHEKSSISSDEAVSSSISSSFKPLKLCKQLVALLICVREENSLKFDVSYYRELRLYQNYQQQQQQDALSLRDYLVRALAQSANMLSVEDFEALLAYFEAEITSFRSSSDDNDDDDNANMTMRLVRFFEFLKYVACDIELNNSAKVIFAEFIQKVTNNSYIDIEMFK